MISRKSYDVPTLAYMRNLGQVITAESYMMIGYDEIFDIEYMFHRYKGYWARDGRTTIFDAFDRYHRDYQNIMILEDAGHHGLEQVGIVYQEEGG